MVPNVAGAKVLAYALEQGLPHDPEDLVVRTRVVEDGWRRGSIVHTVCSLVHLQGGTLRSVTCAQAVRLHRRQTALEVADVRDRTVSIRSVAAIRRRPNGPSFLTTTDGTVLWVTEPQRRRIAGAMAGAPSFLTVPWHLRRSARGGAHRTAYPPAAGTACAPARSGGRVRHGAEPAPPRPWRQQHGTSPVTEPEVKAMRFKVRIYVTPSSGAMDGAATAAGDVEGSEVEGHLGSWRMNRVGTAGEGDDTTEGHLGSWRMNRVAPAGEGELDVREDASGRLRFLATPADGADDAVTGHRLRLVEVANEVVEVVDAEGVTRRFLVVDDGRVDAGTDEVEGHLGSWRLNR